MTSSDQLSNPDQSPFFIRGAINRAPTSSCCPVSGLPVNAKPEWTEIRLKSDYSVTFSIIGKSILLIIPKGYPSEEGAKDLLEKRTEGQGLSVTSR